MTIVLVAGTVALLSTLVVQVPLHRQLAQRHDSRLAQRLVTTNWIRTMAWTARGLVSASVILARG